MAASSLLSQRKCNRRSLVISMNQGSPGGSSRRSSSEKSKSHISSSSSCELCVLGAPPAVDPPGLAFAGLGERPWLLRRLGIVGDLLPCALSSAMGPLGLTLARLDERRRPDPVSWGVGETLRCSLPSGECPETREVRLGELLWPRSPSAGEDLPRVLSLLLGGLAAGSSCGILLRAESFRAAVGLWERKSTVAIVVRRNVLHPFCA